ncbi:MAG: GNAT family N-acetyltransferase [Puniceicoccaceae bacterium]
MEIDFGTELYARELVLRDAMLRKPIGLKHSEADLEKEPGYRHFGLLLEGHLVACLMVVPHGDELVQIRQMAVRDDLQGRGYGRFLMTAVEPILEASGVGRIFLNARHTAIAFYEKLGYAGVGERFTEVGIPHLPMEKALRSSISS